MKKHVLTLSILFLSGCASDFRVPTIIDTSENYAAAHNDYDHWYRSLSPFYDETPRINPYTYNPACKDSDGMLKQDCPSYYSMAMGQLPPNSYSLQQARQAKKTDALLSKGSLNGASGSSISMSDIKEVQERILSRDALIEALIGISQEAVSLHQASTQAVQTDTNLFFKLATAGTGAAAQISSGGAKEALTAATVASGAAKSGVSEEVYQQKTVQNINSLVTQMREKKLIELRNSLATKDIYEYSVDRGIADVLEYHESGSFYKALELITPDLAKAVSDNKNFTDDAKGKQNLDEQVKSDKLLCYVNDDYAKARCDIVKKREAETAAANKVGTDTAAMKAVIEKMAADVKKFQADCEAENAKKRATTKDFVVLKDCLSILENGETK